MHGGAYFRNFTVFVEDIGDLMLCNNKLKGALSGGYCCFCFPVLWSIFITYILTHHGLGGFSGLINGLIAAAIGALSMLMSEPTAKKLCKEDMYVCPRNRDIYIYIYIYILSWRHFLAPSSMQKIPARLELSKRYQTNFTREQHPWYSLQA